MNALSTSMLVSVHLPKTAGTSFASTLQSAFGAACMEDYADLPMQTPRWQRRWRAVRAGLSMHGTIPDAVTCIHGHFLPIKYRIALGGRDARYITWLRDPVERLLSHYHYWRRDYDGSDPAQPLRNRMLREHWSLERFALGPELRNVYRQYLWGFDPSRFDFIGITEHYADDLERLTQRYLSRAVAVESLLVNPERGDDGYAIDDALRDRIERHHAADRALYRWALRRREMAPVCVEMR